MDPKSASTHERAAVARFIAETVNRYVEPFWWGELDVPGGRVFDNGTAFLLDCGCESFLVTAAHVVLQCICDIGESESPVVAKFGDVVIDPASNLIGCDKTSDIATIRLTEDQIRQSGKEVVGGSQASWPPQPPTVPQMVFMSGFPGQERGPQNEYVEGFGIYFAILKTTSVSNSQISLQIDQNELEDYLGAGLPGPGYNMGGFSGAPLFTMIERAKIWSWQLVGVVCEASSSLDLVRATRADFIKATGQVVPIVS